jgi:uncharacterized protein (TIGR02118 family)
MIRLTFLLRRKPALDLEAFQHDWRSRHGPLVASLATTLGIARYVQVHTLEEPLGERMRAARGGMESPYDGVAELWWESEEVLAGALETPAGQDAARVLAEDEARFIDLRRSPLWLAHEYPQVNPTPETLVARPRSGLVKLFFALRLRGGLTLAEGQRDWHTRHGPLIRSQAAASGIRRYVQVHRYESPLEPTLRASRGVEVEAYAGHAELWLDRTDLSIRTPDRAEAADRAVRDEARFIDFARSSIWLGHEHVLIDAPSERAE